MQMSTCCSVPCCTGQPLTREQLIPEIGAFMMAGFDTSSHTIAWCLFTIATHLEVQREVCRELKEAGLLHGGCGWTDYLASRHRLTSWHSSDCPTA